MIAIKPLLEKCNKSDYGFKIEASRETKEEKSLTLAIQGYLDNENVRPFLELCGLVLDECRSGDHLILDMDGLSYASSTGLGALTTLLLSCRERSVSLHLYRIRPKVLTVMDMLGFTSFFSVSDSLDHIQQKLS